jgi:cell division cycle protein 20 (cofactor of APC complex)
MLVLVHEAVESDYINVVRFSPNGKLAAVGTDFGEMFTFDLARLDSPTAFEHEHGISALAWKSNTSFVAGDPAGDLYLWDIRSHSKVAIKGQHRDRIVGLTVSKDGLFAFGDNEKMVNIWDERRLDRALFKLDSHKSAVRAMQWCPWDSNILATGGGIDDGTICFHNTDTGKLVKSVSTSFQICDLLWSLHYKELITVQPAVEKQMTIWKFPIMAPIRHLQGHQSRPMHLAMSPDGQTIASVGDDETLKVYRF